MLRTTDQLLRKGKRCVNQSKAILIMQGLSTDTVGLTKRSIDHKTKLDLPSLIKASVRFHIETYQFIDKQIKSIEKLSRASITSQDKINYELLTPSEYSSGEKVHHGRITGQGNPWLRTLLKEAAWALIRKDPTMRDAFERVATQTKGKKKAIVAIARKRICRMHAMIIKQESNQISVLG